MDLNLIRNLGDQPSLVEWDYLFRETTYGIWFWHNQCIHDKDIKRAPPRVFTAEVMRRVKLLQEAHSINTVECYVNTSQCFIIDTI